MRLVPLDEIFLICVPNSTVSSPVFASPPEYCTESGISSSVNDMAPSNAWAPMVVTAPGRTIDVRAVDANALSPTVVSCEG